MEVNVALPPRGKREKKLFANAVKGKKLLDEFAKCERDVDALSTFVRLATGALAGPQEWPTRSRNKRGRLRNNNAAYDGDAVRRLHSPTTPARLRAYRGGKGGALPVSHECESAGRLRRAANCRET